ncbi:MAG TPA: 3-methyl-2-oxobutanoate dehydrogenase subunit VorB [Hungateiclostridium thermocellum]|jgi:2-oxoglutarate ferredoxin oxidoreductase subunit alpha|nr:3-methyl-2-oxobutanoate dehydrogenase subunit VorB [Acetivibrio thermocellus]ADU74417.1 pyruvate flavodoxin/ferredoxin oxidoreductase domain protein [Acetivibrio thermocellus DSM 1313]ALX08360.1 3-methyl-2-oxobutanoate dehydrogenase (ferredoxin) [Acetivibrio thermocellus AD2]ANV76109.1 3-methyl-2-oxobutanoate dehydrogenase (ferredoxin) [Acetivibrio thermocellus DSM 2360]EIC05789.1 pyruvate flavodoxin/ferredoxin oxidoreductase domain protein [Acetivibrio thermocellus YS]NLU27250.1 3-methyl-2
MGEKLLMKGNEAIAEAALRAGCRHYFGYPITPQTEIAHYLAKKMPEVGGTFIQAESEVAAINMVYGAASAGARVLTSSSSPGISLKQEGLSYLAGAELPAVVVNIVRCGPGLGGILPAQGDYFQAVKGGGHGDYKMVVLAPSSVQELYELTVEAFNIADRYRIVSMIMGDGILGQMMEAVEFKDVENIEKIDKPWATTGTQMKREHNTITSIYIQPEVLEKHNQKLQAKYRLIEERETRVESYNCENADIIVTAFGTVARIVKNVIKMAEKEGIKVGLIRPITLWPFPTKEYEKYADVPKAFLTVELNAGQMVEDVRLAVNGKKPVYFHGRMGGMIPTQKEILDKIKEILNN